MNRDQRASMAKQTVAICDNGFYTAPGNRRVEIGPDLARAKAGTVLYSPENPPIAKNNAGTHSTRFVADNETTFQALERLAASGEGHLACLNFASAKNAGGG